MKKQKICFEQPPPQLNISGADIFDDEFFKHIGRLRDDPFMSMISTNQQDISRANSRSRVENNTDLVMLSDQS